MLDVTRLRVLVAVARHGSVTAAARALNYAQPSVSHHLSRLEAETGALLTQRAGRGVRLTDAGRLLAERAEEILGRLDAAENELAAHVGLRAGRIRLAAFPSALSTIVPAAATRLEAENPGLDLSLAEAEPPEALHMLRAGYVDVALVFRHYQDGAAAGPPSDPDGRHPVPADPGRPDPPGHPRPGRRRRRAAAGAAGPGRVRGPALDRRLRALPQLPGLAVRAGRVRAEDRVHHRRLRRRAGPGGGRPGRHHAARPGAPRGPASGRADRGAARIAPRGAGGHLRRGPEPPAVARLLDVLSHDRRDGAPSGRRGR